LASSSGYPIEIGRRKGKEGEEGMNLNKQEREALRMMLGGRCAYCGCELGAKWHADHVDPIYREWWKTPQWLKYHALKPHFNKDTQSLEFVPNDAIKSTMMRPENDHIGNLFPSCAPCNIDKGANSLDGWREWLHHRIVDCLRSNSSTFRHAERFGVVSINTAPLVFWFEKWRMEHGEKNG
jgi:hypothetical protein